jgi:hypothetical protein
MNPISAQRRVGTVARWFEPPETALRFAAYAFARATHEDMQVLRKTSVKRIP